MALAPLTLDDLTWAQMVEAARRRIVAASGGTWTLHAPVDPGVTLLELFTWLLEQRVYFGDQVTPELTRAILRLLDERPRAAIPAATVLRFDSGDNFVRVGAGTEMRLQAAKRSSLVFSTEASVTVVPLTELQLSVGGVDRSADIGVRAIELAVPGQPMDVTITLALKQALPAGVWPALGLFVELDTGPVQPSWVPGEPTKVQPPATVTWNRPTAQSALLPWKGPALHDGTGGLRRSGVVQLPLDQWSPVAGGGNRYQIMLRCNQTYAFSFPPRLVGLQANVAETRHRRHIAVEPYHASWLPLAGTPKLELADDAGPASAETVELSLRERDHEWHPWHLVADFSAAGPADRVFTVDRERGVVGFGDGLAGRLPVLDIAAPAGSPAPLNVKLRYDAGGGAAGNFSAGQAFEAAGHHLFRALSLVPSVGGADPEGLDQARDRAAEDLKEVTRAVLATDYETLARTTPGAGIQRAHAAVGVHPSFSCLPVPGAVTVILVPWAPRPVEPGDSDEWDLPWTFAPQPDPGVLASVGARLDQARLVASEVFVRGPLYRRVKLTVTLQGDSRDPAALRTVVTRRLRRFLDPLSGGEDGTGWMFGEPVRPSALLREVQGAVGSDVEAVAVVVILDDVEPSNECTDVKIGAHQLVQLDAVEVVLTRVVSTRGGLR